MKEPEFFVIKAEEFDALTMVLVRSGGYYVVSHVTGIRPWLTFWIDDGELVGMRRSEGYRHDEQICAASLDEYELWMGIRALHFMEELAAL